MNSEKLMEAIGCAGGRYVEELIELMDNKKNTRRVSHGRFAGTLLAAVLILSLLTVSAVAAGRYFGLFDFLTGGRALPDEARGLIETDLAAAQADEDFPLDCTVKEALADGRSVRLVAELSADSQERLLLLPQDAMESDPAAGLGLDSSLTVGEYAQSKGLTLMWIGAGIKYDGALDINSQSIDYRSVSDGVIDVMISAVTNTAADDMDFTLDLSAHRGGADGVARRELNVKLKNGALSEERSYVPSGSGAIPGIDAAVISAAVTQTEVETYLEIRCTRDAAGMEALDSEGLSFRIYAADGTELPSSSGSGALEPDENGEYVTGYVLYKCDPGESFTLEAFNCWEKNVYGRIEMKAG